VQWNVIFVVVFPCAIYLLLQSPEKNYGCVGSEKHFVLVWKSNYYIICDVRQGLAKHLLAVR